MLRMPSSLSQIAPCLSSSSGRGLAPLRHGQLHAGTSRLGQPNGNGLLRRLSAMLSFANMMHLFTDKLAGLCTGRFSLLRIVTSSFHYILFLLLHVPYLLKSDPEKKCAPLLSWLSPHASGGDTRPRRGCSNRSPP